MDTDAMFRSVAGLRHALCDQLSELTDEQWNADSLCAGWRVRDVLGHLVSLQDVPTWRFMLGKPGLGGFNARADRFAREYGTRAPAELITLYREHADGRVAPPMMGPIAPLTDIAVHALDIQRPLGLPPTTDDESTRRVLDRLGAGLPGFTPKRLVRGLRFETTDLDWAMGDGRTVRASGADLLLALMGRPVDWECIDGDGAALLRSRL